MTTGRQTEKPTECWLVSFDYKGYWGDGAGLRTGQNAAASDSDVSDAASQGLRCNYGAESACALGTASNVIFSGREEDNVRVLNSM